MRQSIACVISISSAEQAHHEGAVIRARPIDPAALTSRHWDTFGRPNAGPRGAVRGPFEARIAVPRFADHAEVTGNYVRFEASSGHRRRVLRLKVEPPRLKRSRQIV
jgi:hypothetical protein